MTVMLARLVSAVLVLVLVGPSVVTATCELTCAVGSHHHSVPATTEAACHEHQWATQAAGVQANPSALCHDSGELPSAVLDAWLNALVISLAPSTTATVAASPMTTRTIARVHERSAPFDPRPAHRPLRV